MDPAVHVPQTDDAPSQHYGEQFLNFTFKDLVLARARISGIDISESPVGGLQRGLSLHSPLVGQDAILLSYCKLPSSKMKLYHGRF